MIRGRQKPRGRSEMPGNPNKYTPEYRLECADYVIQNGITVPEGAKALGLNEKTLGTWVTRRRKELAAGTADAAGSGARAAARADEDAELRRAQRRIRELEMENAFLKKAAAFFARDQA